MVEAQPGNDILVWESTEEEVKGVDYIQAGLFLINKFVEFSQIRWFTVRRKQIIDVLLAKEIFMKSAILSVKNLYQII